MKGITIFIITILYILLYYIAQTLQVTFNLTYDDLYLIGTGFGAIVIGFMFLLDEKVVEWYELLKQI